MGIKLSHPYITNYWVNHFHDNENKPKDVLIIETHLKMPDKVRGFRDKRFPELMNYIAGKTRSYWSNFSDIEIRSTVH